MKPRAKLSRRIVARWEHHGAFVFSVLHDAASSALHCATSSLGLLNSVRTDWRFGSSIGLMSGVIVFYHGIFIRIAVYYSFCRGLKRSDRYGLLKGLPWGIRSEVRKKEYCFE